MNYSGILVIAAKGKLEQVVDSLNAEPDLEVHQIEEDTGRLIVVQEGESVKDEVNGLKRIKKMPGVVLAEMVYHYFAESADDQPETLPDDIDELTGLKTDDVPAYFNE
ncbi:MAG: nitrate reductase formation protein NapD [Gammaproteobacteria bacterium]|nr:MAG: nitrate reductase formation protein NapD [Gammaproteobacteria bacterium]